MIKFMRSEILTDRIYSFLGEITDPEIPVVSILDLGIVRDVILHGDKHVEVVITPTYSGCPAMDMISMQIRMNLMSRGFDKVDIKQVLSPAWTTDWISEEGKRKMKAYGIAPPQRLAKNEMSLFEKDEVPCPRCDSNATTLISEFGSTSCKALFRCLNCKEPFEYFKCH